MQIASKFKYQLFWALLGAIFFIPFLGGVHLFDWDEINFAEIAREMVVLDNYMQIHVNYVSFTEKPPLFFWLQAISMNLFGVGEFAARFPNAIAGVFTLPIIYSIGRKLKNHQFGMIWAMAYFGTVLPHLYFKSGLIDPIFNLFIFLGLYFLILFYWKKEKVKYIKLNKSKAFYLIWAGLFTGVAILTKGPVAYLLISLTVGVYWISKRFKFFISIPQYLVFTLFAIIVSLMWFGIEIAMNGTEFIKEFTIRQYTMFSTHDAGQKGFPGYHFVVLLLGCFPASLFAIQGHLKQDHEHPFLKDFKQWMVYLFWVVLILFTIVQSKIVHYSSMTYFPLTYLAALSISRIIEKKAKFTIHLKWGLIAIASLYALVIFTITYFGNHMDLLKELVANDPFASANMDADVKWTGWEVIPGILILGITIASILLIRKDKSSTRQKGFNILFFGNGLFVFLTLVFFIARVEKYSQNAAVEFVKEKSATEDCYITTLSYKSYVHQFYLAQTEEQKHTDAYVAFRDKRMDEFNDDETTFYAWDNTILKRFMLNADIDKPAYFIIKINKAEKELERYPQLEKIGEKNGYVFLKRRSLTAN